MYQKKKTPYITFIVLLILIMVLFYLISGVCNIPDVSIYNIEESLVYSFMHPLSAWNDKTIAFLGIGFLIWMGIVSYYLTYHRNYHETPYGSEEWRDVHEANEYYRDKDDPKNNRTITQNLEVSLSLRGTLSNNNMGVFASSGCYKTTGIVEQNILKFASTYIILDVKEELLRRWGKAFQREDYKINVINFKQPEKSDQFNPFVFIETEADVLRIASSIHESCRPKKEVSMQDPFWDDALNLYSQALYFAEWLRARETGKVGTMNGVIELASWESEIVGIDPVTDRPVTKLEQYMDDLADKYGTEYPPVRDYRKLKKGAPDTVNSVILMLNGMLNICSTAEVKRIFDGNDISFREYGTGVSGDPSKKSVLFLCIPDDNPVYNWIVSLVYNQAIQILTRLSDDEIGGPLPIRVEFWMDEFYAGCRPADVDKLLGIVRGRNISMVLILQSLAQLQALYPKDVWKIIMDNLAVVILAGSGPGATETHEYFSKALGKTTIDTRNDNIHHGTNANYADNFNQMGRELMTPTEVKRLPLTDAIVLIESSLPIYDQKAIPFDVDNKNYRAPEKRKKWYKELRSLGDYEHPVYTVYDPVHFHYITVKQEKPMQVVTDKKDIEALQIAAMKDDSIYTYNVNEDELLYLSWGSKEYTLENVEEIYQQAMKDAEFRRERMKGLIVLQNIPDADVPKFGTEKITETDKSAWDTSSSLKQLIADHWDDLSAPEQEEMLFAMDAELKEDQLKKIMLCSLSEMAIWRRTYVLENQGNE